MCQRAAVGLGALHAAVCAWDLLKEVAIIFRASLVVQRLKCLPPMQETQVRSLGLIPGLGGSPGEGNGNPLQYSCLENAMVGGAW